MSPCLATFLILATTVLTLSCGHTVAQTLTIGGSLSAARGTTTSVVMRFDANPSAPIAAYDLQVVYDTSRFGTPTCTTHLPGANCAIDAWLGRVTYFHVDPSSSPVPTGDHMTIQFPVLATAPPGVTYLGARSTSFSSPLAHRVATKVHTGQVRIQ